MYRSSQVPRPYRANWLLCTTHQLAHSSPPSHAQSVRGRTSTSLPMGLLVTNPRGLSHQQVIVISSLVYILDRKLAEGHLPNYVATWRQGGSCHAPAWDPEGGKCQVAEKQALENPSWEVTDKEAARQGMLLSQVPKSSEHAPLPHWNSLSDPKFKDNVNDFKTVTAGPFGAHSPMWLLWLYTHEVNPGQCAAQAKYQRKQLNQWGLFPEFNGLQESVKQGGRVNEAELISISDLTVTT